ncbi:MAG TPA: hypothetical protein VLR94_09535 [Acidobacteriota bacterium]|nr:hypothetical protein [Acidobacteriota bacterium]
MLWGIGGSFAPPVDTSLSGYLNVLVTKMAPFLKQDGDPQKLDAAAGPAMTVSWSGTSDDGMKVTARTFSVVHESFAFVLVMLGNQERMALREAVVREIFASFRFSQGVRDRALTGNWQSPAAAAQTQPAGDAGIWMELRPDGSFELQEPDPDSEGEGRISGTWYAADGSICFVYPESFFLNFRYELGGAPGSRKLTLRHSSGATQVLVEALPEKKKG